MAENIVKLRVDGKDFDQNIKSARQGLLAMEQACRKSGETFENVEKENLDFVRALGKMETTSKSAKGKIAELTSAFTDLKAQYNRLTDAEKQGQFGKALSKSLNELKGRIQAGNTELRSIQGELGNTGGGLSELASKFGLSVGKMGAFAAAGAAVTGALKVAKDAFFASEENLDAWNRAIEQSEAVYSGFLTAINTGDISGFLSRIDQIKQAAREAYDELDRLGTQKTMDNKSLKTQQTENERMRAMLRTGRYIAPLDGRASAAGLKNGDKLSKTQLESIAKNLEGGLQKVNRIFESEINQTGKSIEALYKKEAANLGMSAEAFKKGTADMQAFDKVIAGYNEYKKFEAAHTTSVQGNSVAGGFSTTVRDKEKNPYEQYKAWGTFLDDGKTFSKINELINQKSALESQQYNAQAQAFRSIDKVEGSGKGSKTKTKTKTDITYDEGSIGAIEQKIAELGKQLKETTSQEVRNGLLADIKSCNEELDRMKGKVKEVKTPEMTTGFSGPSTGAFSAWAQSIQKQMSTVDITTPLYQNLQEQLADTTTLQNLVKTAMENGFSFKDLNFDVEGMWSKILGSEGVENADWQGIVDAINAKLAELNLPPIQLKFETGNLTQVAKESKEVSDHVKGVSSALGAAASAFGQYASESEAAAEAQKAFTIAAAIATLVGQFAAIPKGAEIWSWIAGTIAGTATLISTIAQIKSSTNSYAEGGWVGGSSGGYVGDAVPAFLNRGEYVMTQSDVETANSNLEAAYSGGGGGRSTISGEQIVTVVNAYGRRTGRGEILR